MKKPVLVLLAFLLSLSAPAFAAAPRDASIVVDAKTGRVLEASNAESLRHPASITKIMTLYLLFKAIKQGTVRVNQGLPVSDFAASQSPTKLGLRPGSLLRVRDAVLAIITLSANDAAVVVAEALGGTEAHFGEMMTQQARALGMNRSVFRNASGLPNDEQVTTARDMAILARAMLFNFPDYYKLFSTRSFTYNGIPHDNHNHLMERYPGMDGIKTGFIRASGFNLVASAVQGNTRLIAVIFGGASARSRDNDMAALLDEAFRRVATMPVEKLAPRVATASPAPAPEAPAQADDEEAAAMAANDRGDENNRLSFEPAPAPAPGALAATSAVREAATAPTLPAAAYRPAAKPAPAPASRWAVQIGAYKSRAAAQKAVAKLGEMLPKNLPAARYQIVQVGKGKRIMFRTRLIALQEDTARNICKSAVRTLGACAVIPPA